MNERAARAQSRTALPLRRDRPVARARAHRFSRPVSALALPITIEVAVSDEMVLRGGRGRTRARATGLCDEPEGRAAGRSAALSRARSVEAHQSTETPVCTLVHTSESWSCAWPLAGDGRQARAAASSPATRQAGRRARAAGGARGDIWREALMNNARRTRLTSFEHRACVPLTTYGT